MSKEYNGTYEVGAILEGTWGYDQTNVDFYKIERRTNDTVWLRPMTSRQVEVTGFMSERVEPGVVTDRPLMRRKLFRDRDGRIAGCRYMSYGWIGEWNGSPATATHYA